MTPEKPNLFGNIILKLAKENIDWGNGDVSSRPFMVKSNILRGTLVQDAGISGVHPSLQTLLPILKVIQASPLVSNWIEYDSRKGEFTCQVGYLWKRVLSTLWLIIMCIYISLVMIYDVQGSDSTKAVIGRLAWVLYSVFYFHFVKCFRVSGGKISRILTDGNTLSFMVGGAVPQCNRKTWTSWVICGVTLVFVFVYVVILMPGFIASTTSLYDIFMEWTKGTGVNFRCGHDDYGCNLYERSYGDGRALAVILLWVLLAYTTNFIWLICLVLLCAWGIYFKSLLQRMVTDVGSGALGILEGAHVYTRITTLLDDFNSTFGSVVFWAVVSLGLYMALILGDFLSRPVGGVVDWLHVACVVLFFVMLYFSSEVNRMGNLLPLAIKNQGLWSSKTWSQSKMVMILQHVRMVQYDALSHNIGMKGFEYFTLSYKFVANLFGVIFTYSLITLQFSIGEQIGDCVDGLAGKVEL